MDIVTHAPGALKLPLKICVTYKLLPLGAEENIYIYAPCIYNFNLIYMYQS